MTFNQQVVHAVQGTVIQGVEGTLDLGVEAKELMGLVERFGGDDAPTLRSAVRD